ncbi:hypothetical protein [Oxynema aestuarii]|uniref:Uncharacterized protein n=1 Tax=Oxynema aestuarii AP17 TaxID=2064643 RepID=A0A6H1U6Q2_9CYAN|nr:hypothetical protein [Oxynema aestuarii]QIZ73309.1 hypothetical protein HCG48_24145 [Oxynema aestuarii AP17]
MYKIRLRSISQVRIDRSQNRARSPVEERILRSSRREPEDGDRRKRTSASQ